MHFRIKTPKQTGEALPRATGKKLKDLRLVDIPVKFKVKNRECTREQRNPGSTRMGRCWREPSRGTS